MLRRVDRGGVEGPEPGKARPATKRANKGLSRDIEPIDLDLTPFMNILMVLIPFLAVMAVLTRIAILEFSLPPAREGGAVQEKKDLDISVVISEQGYRIVGTASKFDLVPKRDGRYQLTELRGLLSAIRLEYPSQKSLVLVIAPDVLYDDIVQFMDACRESKFTDIGFSAEVQ